MKIEIEIPDEDIKKLEESEGFMEIFPPNFDIRAGLKLLIERACEDILKKAYEAYLLLSSGATDEVGILVMTTDNSIKTSIEVLKEIHEKADKEVK